MTSKRSALIVATSEYRDTRLATLDGPSHDAEALRTVLANKQIGDFDVRVALNSRVDTLRRTLESFFADRARDDLLLVHFSGHGLKDDDGQLYLAAADTQLDRLLSTGIDAGWVNRLMNKCRSEKIALFLDCCFAGAFTSGMTRRAAGDTAGVKDHFNGSGLFVITASDAMQYSFEGGQQVGQPPEPSPFTKALVDGLLSGEADRNEDGEVSINELFDYLEDRIRETSPSQTPTKSAFNQVGDWSIARSTRAPSVRLLPETLQAQLKSDNPLDRIGAIFDLRDLLGGADPRLADAAIQALQRLAQDDSRTVAARAERVLEEEASRPRAGARVARRRPTPTAPPEPAEIESPVTVEPEPQVVETELTAVEPASQAVEPESRAVETEPRAVEPEPQAVNPERAPVDTEPAPVEPIAEPSPVAVLAAQPSASAVAPAALPYPVVAVASQPEPPVVGWQAPASARPAERSPSPTGTAAAIPWDIRRAIGRVAIGSFLSVMAAYTWFLAANAWILDSPSDLDQATQVFSEFSAALTIVATIVIAAAERLIPALRLAGGSAYGFSGGNRWIAAGALGVVSALTIGPAVAYLLGYLYLYGWGQALVCTALAFIAAEAIIGRRFQGHLDRRNLAA